MDTALNVQNTAESLNIKLRLAGSDTINLLMDLNIYLSSAFYIIYIYTRNRYDLFPTFYTYIVIIDNRIS